MNKLKLSIIVAVLLAVLISSGVYVYNNYFGKNTQTDNVIEILQDGKVLQTIDLSTVDETQIITVEYQGHYNKIQIEKDNIKIIDADCPDKLCVNMGYLKRNAPPIVCLPHHLVIQYADNSLDANAN